MKTITVEVTAADIELAKSLRPACLHYSKNCLVAVAVGRQLETACEVGFNSVRIGDDWYELDNVGYLLRLAFDEKNWSAVVPCVITLTQDRL